jgi:hypothetical protein
MIHNANDVAQAIIDLINSKPQSPTKDELASIIAKVASPAADAGAPKLRAEWDAAMAACKAAEPLATDEEMGVASERVDACARRIVSKPVHGLADVLLLAEACYWMLWSDPSGLTGPDADAQLAAGPAHDITETCAEALAALLKGVRAVGMRTDLSRTSRCEPVLPAALDVWRNNYLRSDWQRIVTAYLDAMAVRGITDEEVERLLNDLCENTKAIWARPCATWDDLIERAAIAVYWNSPDEPSEPAYPDDVLACEPDADHDRGYDDHALAHVVKAILDQAGLRFDGT